ncbi:hypothetical protein C1H76_8166 [Elsinoe australis]|uniref:Uncharacterized protein n=1 Tax=Elsinoe australis TaxID=40998 RepID=A0A4U7ASR7_9PEZI|nr:hypothetical protein C1H76_8166 [Elsinoe australis]
MSYKGSYDMPPPEVQRVLLRLNNLGAQVLRQRTTGNAFESIGEKLDELEQFLKGSEWSPRIHFRHTSDLRDAALAQVLQGDITADTLKGFDASYVFSAP